MWVKKAWIKIVLMIMMVIRTFVRVKRDLFPKICSAIDFIMNKNFSESDIERMMSIIPLGIF